MLSIYQPVPAVTLFRQQDKARDQQQGGTFPTQGLIPTPGLKK